MDNSYRELLRSSRVSAVTREALEARLLPDDPNYLPQVLDGESLDVLRALLAHVIPQPQAHEIDFACRIDQRLAAGTNDGWRFAALPVDGVAYRRGLGTLTRWAVSRFGSTYVQLASTQQTELISFMAAGGHDEATTVSQNADDFNRAQMRAWFEELRADAVRLYVGMPTTLERIGYSGIANGGDGVPKTGFVRVGLDEREDWEPLPLPAERP